MQTIYRAVLTVAAIVFLLPISGQAEIKAGSFEVSPFVGYNLFENDQNLTDDPTFGGRIGYNFTKHFGIEAVVEYIRTSVDNKSTSGTKEGQYRSPADDVDLTFYHLNAVYHFMPDGRFNPFILAGLGGAHYSPEISDTDMGVINVGIGAKYWLRDNIALRVDLRDTMVTEFFQETYHNLGATVGIVFAFGGAKKPVAVQPEERTPAPVIVEAPEPEPAPVVVAPKVEEKYIVLVFEDIYFDFDESTLTNEAKAALQKNLQVLQDNPKTKIRIEGYTSAAGSAEYNKELSERRATAVKDYLVTEGLVAPDRLTTVGYGATNPARHEMDPKDIKSKAAKANMRSLFEIIVNGE